MAVTTTLQVRTLFAPFDDTQGEFLKFIESAQERIDMVIFGLHLPPLTDILIAKHQAGVKVSLLLDHSQAEGKAESTEVQRLVAAGVPLTIGTSPVHRQILHSKFTVVDGARVEHGSWNYSLSASAQSNTMCFVEGEGARDYAVKFQRHHDRLLAFCRLHEMAMQPAGEVAAEPALVAVAAKSA